MAKGYILVELEVPDPAAYAASGYMAMASASVAAHGGRFLVRGGAPEMLEGDASPQRVVVLEFPSRADAEAFYRSAAYAPAIALRQSLSSGRMVLVSGADA